MPNPRAKVVVRARLGALVAFPAPDFQAKVLHLHESFGTAAATGWGQF